MATCRVMQISKVASSLCRHNYYKHLENGRSFHCLAGQPFTSGTFAPSKTVCANQKYRHSQFSGQDLNAGSPGTGRQFSGSKTMWGGLSLLAGSLGISYFVWKNRNYLNRSFVPTVSADGPPIAKPSRSIRIESDKTGLDLTLYQYQTCPFCCKVRAYLDYMGISYDIVEVNPVLRQQIKFSAWKKVPILILKNGNDYQELNDSSTIISLLQSHLIDRQKNWDELKECYPLVTFTNDQGKEAKEFLNRYNVMYGSSKKINRSTVELQEESKWRLWVDDVFVHTLSPNVYRTMGEAKQAFDWFSIVGEWQKNFPFWERLLVVYLGATAMYFVGKRLKKRHALKDDVRESLYDACKEWTSAIGQGKNFAGGKYPNLADLAMYGVLNAIEGCTAFKDLLDNTDIGPWFERMKSVIAQHDGVSRL